ncbi:hypothetical protein [Microbacterium sp. NPDC056569]|uniref:hypothetical protein n=1 Tax=Microbacterium sp. NPDC056569 TaxID=3345867 RepID=UPI00366F8A61
MLATILPGLRDVRVPLATGFLWLTFLWLALARYIPDPSSATGLLHELNRAFLVLGSAALIAAASFIAYIIGVMTTFRARSLFRASGYIWPTVLALYPKEILDRLVPGARQHFPEMWKRVGVALSPSSGSALEAKVRAELNELARRGVMPDQVIEIAPALAVSWDIHRQRRGIEDSSAASFWEWIGEPHSLQLVSRDVVSDFEQNARSLRKASAEDYDEFDRLQAEAEFRISIALPLCAILAACLTYVQFGELESWVSALIIPLAVFAIIFLFFGFVARSMQKFGEANDILVDAIVSGEIESSTLRALGALKNHQGMPARLRAGIRRSLARLTPAPVRDRANSSDQSG